uniref:Nuclear condensin complex subunit 3 C-terminal domain-containing protein n=1 Tax=Kalanchoe fedtschenkoi TaxID=63787 RepID=A0A7N0TSV2_KALFE
MVDVEDDDSLIRKIGKILDEARSSNAVHVRKLKDLAKLRSSSHLFFSAFSKALIPVFVFPKRTASVDRIVRLVAVFAATRDLNAPSLSNEFLEEFVRFLLVASSAASKTARLRSCQIISEIIMRLPDDAEVSDDLWDDVIECMKLRIHDKDSVIRSYAVRALSRFADDSESSDILELLLQALASEQIAGVRKALVLSLPAMIATSAAIIDCSLDVSESVRRAAYCALARKFPLQSISIKLRTIILQRGLADRSLAVRNDCLKLMRDEWLMKCCSGDPVKLLQYLDVETYDSVGESVMEALLEPEVVHLQGNKSIDCIFRITGTDGESYSSSIQLLGPEHALYWRTICQHLHKKAQEKGCDAAVTMGSEAVVYAAEASDNNDLLEKVLPATISDYVAVVEAHLAAGPDYHFASRQLLLLGGILDFSDATNRKVATIFVKELLFRPLEHEIDENGNKVILGDGISLGGDKNWSVAVSVLARKVHAAVGEYEDVVFGAMEELALPCRERAADFMQWMHCLALAELLLGDEKSFVWLQKKINGSAELLQSLLLPGAKHSHLDVQRAALRCLGLFGLLESRPSGDLVKQLRLSFVNGPLPISIVACKGLFDLAMWHSPHELNNAMGEDLTSQLASANRTLITTDSYDREEYSKLELLDLLYAGFDGDNWYSHEESIEDETLQTVLVEGFSKLLLLSENYPRLPSSLHPVLLVKLITLYFSDPPKGFHRLKQCLSVFFDHYPPLSAKHKKWISKAFIGVMRAMWPGIKGNASGSPLYISNMRKRAVQASHFILEMMQAPLYHGETKIADENGNIGSPKHKEESVCSFACEEEGLAIRIATEAASFPVKKSAAERSYVSALCKLLILLHQRSSEQIVIKCILKLMNRVLESVSAEKEIFKEVKQWCRDLKELDKHPEQTLLPEQFTAIFETLELDVNIDMEDLDNGPLSVPPTPAPFTTRQKRSKRKTRFDDDDDTSEEDDTIAASLAKDPLPPASAAQGGLGTNVRSGRASKTAALNKITSSSRATFKIDEDDGSEEGSDVTSEVDSDQFDSE